MTWSSDQLPWTTPPNESLEARAYQDAIRYFYNAAPLRRKNGGVMFDVLKYAYTPPPVVGSFKGGVLGQVLKFSYSPPPVAGTYKGGVMGDVLRHSYTPAPFVATAGPGSTYLAMAAKQSYTPPAIAYQPGWATWANQQLKSHYSPPPVLPTPGWATWATQQLAGRSPPPIVPVVSRPIRGAQLDSILTQGVMTPSFPWDLPHGGRPSTIRRNRGRTR